MRGLIVDVPGSSLAEHKKRWDSFSRHFAPNHEVHLRQRKVNGVHTGVDVASCERIILADDDIR